jgi:hypothetical protein
MSAVCLIGIQIGPLWCRFWRMNGLITVGATSFRKRRQVLHEGQTMNWIKGRSAERRRPGRRALIAVAAVVTVAVMLLGACSSEPGTSVNSAGGDGAAGGSGTVTLNPPSGRVNLTPTWKTSTGCPSGYQGSAIFRIIQPSGYTFSISGATNDVTGPFEGTMLDPLGIIQDVARVPNGSTAELVVICFSGDSLTGTLQREMHIFVTFSANGFNYTSSSTAPADFTPPPTPPTSS